MIRNFFIFFSIALLINACDLFVTRDAELPDQGRSNFQPATEPSIVIQNLINSFADKNVQNYLACFVDSAFSDKEFTFSPSSEVLSQYQFLGEGWNLNDEQQYFTGVISRVPDEVPVTLSFSDSSVSQLGDSISYSANYFLNVPHNDSEPMNYMGNVQFKMVVDSRSIWVIYFWQDIKSPQFPSWSELKGIFY